MLVTDPVAKANAVTTELQAARLRDDLTVELSLTDDEKLPPGWGDQAEEALRVIDERFPGNAGYEFGSAHTDKSGGPSLSHHAKRALADDGHTSPPAQRTATRQHVSTPRPGSRRARTRPQPRRGAGIGRQAAQATGIPAAASSGTKTVLGLLGAALGLTMLYLLLTNAEKQGSSSAVSLFTGGVATAARALIAPVDPLRPGAGGTQKTAGTSSAAPTPARRSSGSRRPSHTTRPATSTPR